MINKKSFGANVKNLLLALLCILFSPSLGAAQSIDGKMREAYAKASAQDKMMFLAVAQKDKKLHIKEAQSAVEQIVLKEIKKGKDSFEKLKILGALRKGVQEKLKVLNNARRKDKKPWVAFVEPELATQIATAISYVVDSAGVDPSLEKLVCLKLVRESTSWSAHSNLTLAYVTDALARDAKYQAADTVGKLTTVKSLCEEKGMLANLDRKYVEQAILSNWINKEIQAGKKVPALLDEVKALSKKKLLCFFTARWAQSFLIKLADVR
jgi:hypothetical protein